MATPTFAETENIQNSTWLIPKSKYYASERDVQKMVSQPVYMCITFSTSIIISINIIIKFVSLFESLF